MKPLILRLWRVFCLMLSNQPSLRHYLQPVLQYIWPGFLADRYRARVLELSWQSSDMLQLTLAVSTRWPGFIAGQHVLLTLEHNGRYISRPFSICSPLPLWQSQNLIRLCCKVTDNGEFTPLLPRLTRDAMVSISAASGEFIWQQPAKATLFIAAGSGITPIAAMLLSQRHWLAPAKLVYRFRGQQNAVLLMQLQLLAARQSLFQLQLSDSQTESATELEQRLSQQDSFEQYYLCGPATFSQFVRRTLQSAGVAEDVIRQEKFAESLPLMPDTTCAGLISITLEQAGKQYQLAVDTQLSVLQGAEQHGMTLPYGCRMGVCFQCVCNKQSGQVRNMRTGVLSGHGAESIQLCISQPVTPLHINV